MNREKTRKNSHTNKQSDDSHRFKVLNRKTKFLILCSVFGASLWFLSKHLEREHNYELRVSFLIVYLKLFNFILQRNALPSRLDHLIINLFN